MTNRFSKIVPFLSAICMLLISLPATASDSAEGYQLYKANCDVCHGMNGGMDMSKRIAPPMIAVRMHYIGSHPDKASFVNAVTSWVQKQDPVKSLMRGAIRRFNLMPPVNVSPQDAAKIAGYIYEGNLPVPDGMAEHINSRHKNGMNMNH